MKTRLDAELVRRELARSREHAADLIESRSVLVGGIPATKPASQVDAETSIVLQGDRDDFVSRGGHKLAGALDVFTGVEIDYLILPAGEKTKSIDNLEKTITNISDSRVKKDLRKIENALEKINKINGYIYQRTDTGKIESGLIAQEVLEIIPEVINKNKDDLYSISYGNMMGIIVEAIKELKELIDK